MSPYKTLTQMAVFLHEKLKIKADDKREIEAYVKESRNNLLHIYLLDADCDSYDLIEALARVADAGTAASAAKALSEVADCLEAIDADIVRRLTSALEDIEFEEKLA